MKIKLKEKFNYLKSNSSKIFAVIAITSLLFSLKANESLAEFKAQVNPIGQNPVQYSPTKSIVAEFGVEHLYVSNGTDSLVGHNADGMLTRIPRSTFITPSQLTAALASYAPLSSLSVYATTASLSGYATTSSLSNYALTSSLSSYVPASRTITINGTASDLSANRTWSVGDILSTGSYTNPSWINSLAYSKVTGGPTALSLTTTGTGAASYNSGTGILNVPTPVNYTSGTGISIASGVITNTAPDQTISIASGNRMSVTGTYPAFTAAFVEPTPTIVTRTVNSNYTIRTTTSGTATVTYVTGQETY